VSISRDFLRREGKATQAEHDAVMAPMAVMLDHVVEGEVPEEVASDLVLGGFSRRRFLSIGGATIAMGAVVAACGSKSKDNPAISGTGTATTAGGKSKSARDITALRTASSLEELAVAVYQKAIDNAGALHISSGVADVAKLFQSQHKDHSNLFQKATTDGGGQAFTDPNPVVLKQIMPTIDALKDETGVLMLALSLEKAAAATYQSTVGTFDNKALNAAIMSVGGVEARHVTVLSSALKMSDKLVTYGAFYRTDGAVAAGTGVS
jgi:hypothetical protein